MSETPTYGELQIDVQRESEQTLIHVRGEVDLSNAARVEEAIASACGEAPGQVVIDLSGLRFIDSTGLSVLVEATRRSREDGNRLRVRGASGQVRRIFEVAGVRDWLLESGDPPPAPGGQSSAA